MDDERVTRARRFFLTVLGGDVDGALGELTDDCEYVVPGHSVLSGRYRGRAEVGSRLHRLFELTAGDVDPVKWEDWMVGVDHVSVLVRLNLASGHQRRQTEELFVVAFAPDGRIRSLRMFTGDESAYESLFGTA